jgi:cytochrome c oxidase assembly protein subunit 15
VRFLGIALAQGAIGYIQYFTKLPELLVGAHLLGATLVWLAIWDLNISGRTTSNKI